MVARALTIAGSDSGGGAGLQADLKTFHRLGVFGTSAVTLITAQNTRGVERLELLAPDLVASQITAVLDDIGADAVKTGALGSGPIIEAVAEALRGRGLALVLDPVTISKHGHPLLPEAAVEALVRELLPLAAIVTPNLLEASALVGRPVENELQMMECARALHELGPGAVVVKGGERLGGEALDVFYDGRELLRLAAPRIETRSTHGTGCTYSAAITALLAKGTPLAGAVGGAKQFLSEAIASAPELGDPQGHGPVNHWAPAP